MDLLCTVAHWLYRWGSPEKKNKCVFMERERDLLEERAHMVMEIEKSHDVLSAN